MDPARAPHMIMEVADYCMAVTRDILRGRDYPMARGPNTDAVEAMLAIACAIETGRLAEPTGWAELRDRVLGMYERMRLGYADPGAPDPAQAADD